VRQCLSNMSYTPFLPICSPHPITLTVPIGHSTITLTLPLRLGHCQSENIRVLQGYVSNETLVVECGALLLPSCLSTNYPPSLNVHSDQNLIALVTPHETHMYLANPEMCREVMVNRWTEFPKPVQTYKLIDIYVSWKGKTNLHTWKQVHKNLGY
jgi:hypothetical protein